MIIRYLATCWSCSSCEQPTLPGAVWHTSLAASSRRGSSFLLAAKETKQRKLPPAGFALSGVRASCAAPSRQNTTLPEMFSRSEKNGSAVIFRCAPEPPPAKRRCRSALEPGCNYPKQSPLAPAHFATKNYALPAHWRKSGSQTRAGRTPPHGRPAIRPQAS